MCGIIGYVGPKPTVEILIDGLKRLEYRGYDSAGLAVVRDGTLRALRSPGGARTRDRAPTRIPWDPVQVEKQGFKHFMLKEIHEQPRTIRDTLLGRYSLDSGTVHLKELGLGG